MDHRPRLDHHRAAHRRHLQRDVQVFADHHRRQFDAPEHVAVEQHAVQFEGARLAPALRDIRDFGAAEVLAFENVGGVAHVHHAQFTGVEVIAQRRAAIDAFALQDQRRDHGVAVAQRAEQRRQPAFGDARVVVQQHHGRGVDQRLRLAQRIHRRAQAQLEEAHFGTSLELATHRRDHRFGIVQVHDPQPERLRRMAVDRLDAFVEPRVAVAGRDDDRDNGIHRASWCGDRLSCRRSCVA